MEPRWWVLVFAVFLFGVAIWAVPAGEGYNNGNRYSEIGAAIAGGAVVAGVVLLIEQATRKRTENETLRFQVSITKDISGIDLRGQNLKDSYWRRKEVRDACLDKAELDGSMLLGCTFKGSLLFGVSFKGAELVGANFSGSSLGGADLTEADLTGADLTGADLSGRRNPYEGGRYGGAAKLAGADLYGADLSDAKLSGVGDISEAKNIAHAKRDANTVWPSGYAPPPYSSPP